MIGGTACSLGGQSGSPWPAEDPVCRGLWAGPGAGRSAGLGLSTGRDGAPGASGMNSLCPPRGRAYTVLGPKRELWAPVRLGPPQPPVLERVVSWPDSVSSQPNGRGFSQLGW